MLDVGLPDGDGLTLLDRCPTERALGSTANLAHPKLDSRGAPHPTRQAPRPSASARPASDTPNGPGNISG